MTEMGEVEVMVIARLIIIIPPTEKMLIVLLTHLVKIQSMLMLYLMRCLDINCLGLADLAVS